MCKPPYNQKNIIEFINKCFDIINDNNKLVNESVNKTGNESENELITDFTDDLDNDIISKKRELNKKKRLRKKRMCGSGIKYIKCCKLIFNNNNTIDNNMNLNCSDCDMVNYYVDPYKEKINDITNFIKNKFPNVKFKLIKNNNSNLEEIIFIDYKANLTILETTELSSVEKRINSITSRSIQKEQKEECQICSNYITTNVSCNRCANNYCIECYIEIYRHGKGIITCPFCRFTYGNKIPDTLIDLGIKQIKNEIKN